MPEITVATPSSRAELRRRVRQSLARLDPSLRVLAEDIYGLTSSIDLVALDAERRVVLILLANDGEDLAFFTRALAQCTWLTPRLRNWAKLAPDLDLRIDAPARAILLAPRFHPETRAAATCLRSDVLQLATYRCIESDTQRTVLLEDLSQELSSTAIAPDTEPEKEIPAFRSGLTENDLQVTAEELRELE